MSVAGAWVCLFAPLGGALAITLSGTRITRRQAGWIATLSVFAGFVGALDTFVRTLGEDRGEREQLSTAFTWLEAGDFEAGLQILVDPLSLTMMLVVTGVGGLIVWYSMGYMAGADEERRFFAYMALFVFSMLLLVEAGNLLLLLVGWGLVGLASYLLIGFDHHRPAAIAAAKKAFIMNALGDATMALGLFLLVAKVGTLDLQRVFDAAEGGELSSTVVTLAALGLLGGAVAKSAQIPLHTWLPDAMEGPTPVSALIHAATMVTAGVYLVSRAHPVFEAADEVQHLAAILGAATLVGAGLIALVQQDIKRVIAYSTMSQIGYMFLAAGVGAYGFALFHLMTHAFFKALLFLAAGLVIHHLGGEQDIRKMGGLRRSMPQTSLLFLVGTLGLVGIPPLAGFWSKDAILGSALATGGGLGWPLYLAGLLGTALTGAYAFRLQLRVFHGEPSALVLERAEAHDDTHGRAEGPLSMLLPVGALAVLTAVGGFLNVAGAWSTFEDWIGEAAEPLVEASTAQDYVSSLIAVTLGVAGALVAWRAFTGSRELVVRPALARALERKFYVDELYEAVVSRPARALAVQLRDRIEAPVVQGSLDEIGRGARQAAGEVARAQTGLLRTYALTIAASVVVLAIVFLTVR